MIAKEVAKLAMPELEAEALKIAGYEPKWAYPLYCEDIKRDTVKWPGEDRWRVVMLKEWLFRTGGFIEDDLESIADVTSINRARNWREKAKKVRSILIKSEKKPGFLTCGYVLREYIKAFNRSALAASGGRAKAGGGGADGCANTTTSIPTSNQYVLNTLSGLEIIARDLSPWDGVMPLDDLTLKRAETIRAGYSIKFLVGVYLTWAESAEVRDHGAAFISFIKTHVRINGVAH